jgi:hypothetical protein
MGIAIPMTFRPWIATPQGVADVSGTSYSEAVSGFYARPLLAGGESRWS